MPTYYFLYCTHFSLAPSSSWAGLQLFTLAAQTKSRKGLT